MNHLESHQANHQKNLQVNQQKSLQVNHQKSLQVNHQRSPQVNHQISHRVNHQESHQVNHLAILNIFLMNSHQNMISTQWTGKHFFFKKKHTFLSCLTCLINFFYSTDIIIGTAQNQSSRVLDYYTRDRSTPRQDSFWGGTNDLTATGGFEENGVTTIIFRRKLESKDITDHSIVNDLMHVIWARGQEPGKYIHSPPSGLEKESASMQNFYQPDELKYHGHKTQRGVVQINFFEEKKVNSVSGSKSTSTDTSINILDNNCEGHWKHPRTCQPDKFNCEYYAEWRTIGKGDEFRFRIQTTYTKTWTGVGFSDDEKMSQTDAIIGWVDQNGRPFLMDTWING